MAVGRIYGLGLPPLCFLYYYCMQYPLFGGNYSLHLSLLIMVRLLLKIIFSCTMISDHELCLMVKYSNIQSKSTDQ